jgi:hypothetical protein
LNFSLSDRLSKIESAVTSRDESARLARECSVRIKVWPAKGGNDLACGTLVAIGRSGYVLTNKHVVRQVRDESSCRRAVVRVYRSGNRTVAVDPSGTKVHERLDLALLPVVDDGRSGNLTLCAIQQDPEIDSWKELVGFRVAESSEQFVNAHIRQVYVDRGVVIGTFPGTNGYSGLGYFMDRALTVVHAGKHTYHGSMGPHEMYRHGDDEHADSSHYVDNLSGALLKMFESAGKSKRRWPFPRKVAMSPELKEAAKNTSEAVFSMVNHVARNPVARSIPAWHARDDKLMISLESYYCNDSYSEEEM